MNLLITKGVLSVFGLILLGFVLFISAFWVINKLFPGGIESMKTAHSSDLPKTSCRSYNSLNFAKI